MMKAISKSYCSLISNFVAQQSQCMNGGIVMESLVGGIVMESLSLMFL